jgi:hypothetical protein
MSTMKRVQDGVSSFLHSQEHSDGAFARALRPLPLAGPDDPSAVETLREEVWAPFRTLPTLPQPNSWWGMSGFHPKMVAFARSSPGRTIPNWDTFKRRTGANLMQGSTE